LKAHVYTPLFIVLMRRFSSPRLEPLLAVLSYFVVFFRASVRHGQTPEFIFFGLLQGGGVAMNRSYQIACEISFGLKAYRRLRATSSATT
jgi:D-alanyl-lipoteichoic acid acyltransferase DltB (MBOAT superfamily)